MSCNCEGKKYNISMGCCQPVLAPIENYYTKYQVDKLIESATTSGVDLSDYVTYEDMSQYVGDVYTKEETNNIFVTKQYFQNNAVSNTEYNTMIRYLRQEIDSLKAAISGCCGTTGETYTRWVTVPNDYTCSGTTKYEVEKEQTSTDGINWTDTGNTRRGSIIEIYSPDCGYEPQKVYKVTMRYIDGTEDERECDGSSNLRTLNPSNWENISGVTVGSCINEIGNLCFYGFSGLTSVSLHNAITKIDQMAFDYCVSLPSITIPNSVTEIGEMAFCRCTSLTGITIPNGITNIKNSTLSQCSSITDIVLPNTLETIGDDAMSHCTSLVSITIPSGVTYIGEHAFKADTSLETVTVLATTPPILGYQNIFLADNNLTAIYVPAASVEAYKASWSTYADLIRVIQ